MKTSVNDDPMIWTALATPFCDDKTIDWQSFEKLLQKQVNSGVYGLVLCGTTGEAPSLRVSEKLSLVKKAKALVGDQLKIMVGTGSNNTEQSVELSKLACEAGADSLLVVTPPYNKPSLSGLVKHFEAISMGTKTPICLYHVPGRTAHRLSHEEVKTICEIDHVFAVKEASSDLSLFSRVVQSCSGKFIFSGDDPTYLPSLSIGAHGTISVVTNIFPESIVAMSKSFSSGDVQRAKKIHQALFPLIEALFCETNPGPLKALLHFMGLSENSMRLPLDIVSQSHYTLLKQVLDGTRAKLEGLSL